MNINIRAKHFMMNIMFALKVPKNFKLMTTKAQKLFRKLLDADPARRMKLGKNNIDKISYFCWFSS